LGEGRTLEISASWADDLETGESVAVDGTCLTVVGHSNGAFRVEAVRETIARTIISHYKPGRRVNLERSLVVGDSLGGHLVQGHVDDVGTVNSIERREENRYISLLLPESGRPLVADRGSIAVNGVSLTVLSVTDTGVRLSIVPHTWVATTFEDLTVGCPVNVEYDLVARYVQRLMEARE
jgi:riboflavin synthase